MDVRRCLRWGRAGRARRHGRGGGGDRGRCRVGEQRVRSRGRSCRRRRCSRRRGPSCRRRRRGGIRTLRLRGADRRRQAPEDDVHEQERDRVEHEGEREATRRHEHAGQHGANDEREIVQGRPCRVGGAKLPLIADECRQVGSDRRSEEGREARCEDREAHDGFHGAVRGHQPGDTQHDHGPRRVRDDEDQPTVEPVRGDAGRHGQQDVRQHAGRTHDAEEQDILAVLVDNDQQGDEVQPVADPGHELAREQAGQRPVPEERAIRSECAHPVVEREGSIICAW